MIEPTVSGDGFGFDAVQLMIVPVHNRAVRLTTKMEV